jgi:ABC transport system ATP-binding/permease protein
MGARLRVRLSGHEYEFTGDRAVTVGRDPAADVPSANPVVSREHLVLTPRGDTWVLVDRTSRSGTFLDGQRVTEVELNRPLTVRLGDLHQGDDLELVPDQPAAVAPEPVRSAMATAGPSARLGQLSGTFRAETGRLRIGRAADNDVVVDDLQVSRYHAELNVVPGGHEIVDLGSHNGTFVNGQRVDRARVDESSIIGLGRHLFRVVNGTLEQYEDTGKVEFEASGLSVMVGENRFILEDVSFALPEKSFLAIVGPSGAGKSTLMKALTGFSPADTGTVLYNGRDLYASMEELRSRIGYVPQDDILHPQLTVRRALEFSAELRFPPDVSAEERARMVTEVLNELGLTKRADLPISKLSGGQRKRTSVALELITKPSLLFLDEPTSGLDPGFEKSAMELLRELADGGRTVIVVTHSLQSLALCDRVIFLAPGGSTAYFGPPSEALEYFGGGDFADVFRSLENEQPVPWKDQFRTSRPYDKYVRGPAEHAQRMRASGVETPPPPPQRSWFAQLGTLVRRQIAVIAADRGLLLSLVLLAPITALVLIAVLGHNGLSPAFHTVAGKRVPVENIVTPNVLFGLVFCMSLIATVDSFREIVKELPILRRERSIGLSLSAYLVSKLVVLIPFVIAQAAVLTLAAIARQNGPSASNLISPPALEMIVDVAFCGVAAMIMGLLISAAVTTSDKATPLMAGIIALQLLLGGALFDIRPIPVMNQLSLATTSRWGYAAVASTADSPKLSLGKCHQPPDTSCEASWKHETGAWLGDIGALTAISVVGVGACAVLLKRRDPKTKRKT